MSKSLREKSGSLLFITDLNEMNSPWSEDKYKQINYIISYYCQKFLYYHEKI